MRESDGDMRRRSGAQDQRRQGGDDLIALRLELRGEAKTCAQARGTFIDREAGTVGRDLPQHSARLTEVDRPEVLPVPQRRDRMAARLQSVPETLLRVAIEGPQRDVVHRSDSDGGLRGVGPGDEYLDHVSGPRRSRGPARPPRLRRNARHPQSRVQHRLRCLCLPDEKRRGVQPAPATMMSAADVAQAVVVGLELNEVICVPGLESTTLFEALRDIQKSTLFGGTSGRLAERYRP